MTRDEHERLVADMRAHAKSSVTSSSHQVLFAFDGYDARLAEQAAEIERLTRAMKMQADAFTKAVNARAEAAEARVKECEAALRPFAREEATWAESVADKYYPGILEPNQRVSHAKAEFSIGDLRRAARLLATEEQGA